MRPKQTVEAELERDPENGDLWREYADLLSAAGDWRGEALALADGGLAEVARADALRRQHAPFDATLRRATRPFFPQGELKALVDSGQLGSPPLGPRNTPKIRIDWRGPFARRLDFTPRQNDMPLVGRMLAHECARFVHSVWFSSAALIDYAPFMNVLAARAKPSVREFRIGARSLEFGRNSVKITSKLSWFAPALQRLLVHVPTGSWSQTRLPELRLLELRTQLAEHSFQALARSQLPALERLALLDPGPQRLRAVTESSEMPELRSLVLYGADPDSVTALTQSPLFDQLTELELHGYRVDAQGVSVLLAAGDQLAGLKRLVIRFCGADDAIEQVVEAIGRPGVDVAVWVPAEF